MVEDDAVLLGVVGGKRCAEQVGEPSQFCAAGYFVAAAEIGEPAAVLAIFEVDDIGDVGGGIFLRQRRCGYAAQLVQEAVDIVFIGVDILPQAHTGTAAFDKQRGDAGDGGVIVSAGGGGRAYHKFHVQSLRCVPCFCRDIIIGQAGIVNVWVQLLVDIAAVHVDVKVGQWEEIVTEQPGCFLRQGAVGVTREFAVKVFAVFGNDEFASGPEAVDIDGVEDDEAAGNILGSYVAAQLHSCRDTGVFTAVDTGSDEDGRAVTTAIDDGDGYFSSCIQDRQAGAQFLSAGCFQATDVQSI